MVEREDNRFGESYKKFESEKRRKTIEGLEAAAKEADPRDAAELQKAAMAERVDLLKAQTQQHQKSITAASAQIQTIQNKLRRLREELQMPAPPEDDPSIKAYKEHIARLHSEIEQAQEELQDLLVEEN